MLNPLRTQSKTKTTKVIGMTIILKSRRYVSLAYSYSQMHNKFP